MLEIVADRITVVSVLRMVEAYLRTCVRQLGTTSYLQTAVIQKVSGDTAIV